MMLDRKALRRYRADPCAFIEECLVNPETGKAYGLLEAERAFLRLAFRRRPDGRLLYPELIYSAIKKSGKTYDQNGDGKLDQAEFLKACKDGVFSSVK